MKQRWRLFLIGWYHAKYHRKLKQAEKQKELQNYNKCKQKIYQAEDAWKQLVKLQEKNKN